MNKTEAVLFIFNIAHEVKRSFENPVILLTEKDYAENIYKSLVDMRTALIKNSNRSRIAEIVYSFHVDWLQAVRDIEIFKKKYNTTPKQAIINSIQFTIESVNKRQEYFQNFIDELQTTTTVEEKNILKIDVDTIREMREIVIHALSEKRVALISQADHADFYVMIMNETEELLNWLDRLNDRLAIEYCKVIDLQIPLHPQELNKTLQEIIEDVTNLHNPEAKMIACEIIDQGRRLSSAIRISSLNDLKISKIIDKIQQLEDRILRLKIEKSSAVTALEHKTLYLEERLQSLENLKLSINNLQYQSRFEQTEVNCDEYNIFNHLLPYKERHRLVENLMKLWNIAIHGDRHVEAQSIISILSVGDMKEVFEDEIGEFFVDKYGRKIYQMDEDSTLYQLNELNKLVPLGDDDAHLYFYDECGRYYLSEKNDRIYKAYDQASEYIMDRSGMLIKYSEFCEDGIKYFFDHLGRYYIDEYDNHIYRERDDSEEYVNDGMGNLIRIQSEHSYKGIESRGPMVLEENLYLKRVIGDALKKCIAKVVITQPPDPIMFLADSLENYQRNIVKRQKLLENEKQIKCAKKDLGLADTSLESNKSLPSIEYEHEIDTNFLDYKSEITDGL